MPISATREAVSKGGPQSTSAPRVPFFRSFTGRLCVLLFLIVIPALLLAIYGNLQQRRSEKARLREGALAISALAAADQENFIRNTRQLLGTLTQFPFLLLSSNRSFSETHLSNLRKLMPDYANFGLIETNGVLFCSAEPWTNSVYLGDRAYFMRAMQSKSFSAGDFQISRVTGDATLGFGYPILNDNGDIARVLYATLKLSKLSEAINQIRLPETGAIEILDRTGTLLARNRQPQKWVGQRLANRAAFDKILAGQATTFESEGPDKVPRLYAVTPVIVGNSPAFFVCVEVPLTVVFAPADRALLINLCTLGLITCAIFLAVRFYAKRFFLAPIKSLAKSARRLAAADLTARVGTIAGAAELIELGRALDEMAGRVQTRTAELSHTNDTLRAEIAERQRAEEQVRQQQEEKRKLEEQVLRSQRMESIGALAGGIAHDLNNALVPVLMGSQILRQGGDNFSNKQQVLDLIATSGQRCTLLVKQILTFARGSRGETDTVPVRHLIDEMAGIARDTFPKNLQVQNRAPKNLWSVKGHAIELHQVLLNLCVNARDAMPGGGQLILSAENIPDSENLQKRHPEAVQGPYVAISVSDTGSGMPPEVRARLFEPFFTTKAPGKGTGLGLSTVANILKRQEGFIEIQTELGKGTEFKIYLPASSVVDTAALDVQTPILPAGNGELILLVDDEKSVLELGRTTLENYGYRLLTAGNGLEAIACFEMHKQDINLLVMDIDMPYLDGLSALRRIRNTAPDLAAIIASGSAHDTVRFSRADISRVLRLTKPYGMEDLLIQVAKALNQSRKINPQRDLEPAHA
jgi:signal transduction histidine kinase/CheY-like chemotaxis protein